MPNAADIKDPKPLAAKDKEAIHEEALTRFDLVAQAERTQRNLGVEDFSFAQTEDGQWDDQAKKARQNRPMYTLNKTAPLIDQVHGSMLQAEVTMRIRPQSGEATAEVAETQNGLIRNIESVSSAQNAYGNGAFEGLNSGYGGWRVVNEFTDDDTFDQDLKIKPINSAVTSLYFDPGAKEYDKRDGMYAFLVENMEKADFAAKYPDADPVDFNDATFKNRVQSIGCQDWFQRDVVRVAEYFRKVPVSTELVQMFNPQTDEIKVYEAGKLEPVLDELTMQGWIETRRRKKKIFKIERYVLNGLEIVEGPNIWPGSKYIPLIPYFGKITHINGRKYVRGLVRFVKDAQRVYNYIRSNIVESLALMPKDPYWMTRKQIEGNEGSIEQMATSNQPVQIYNPDEKAPGPPQRTGAPQVQQAAIEIANSSEGDIIQTMGVSPSTAQATREGVDRRSAEAVLAQEASLGDGIFTFYDNYVKSIEYTGMVLIDAIPATYDAFRQIRIMRPDQSTEMVFVNKTVVDTETAKEVVLNDLSQGKYDITVSTGPAFATKRLETANRLNELAKDIPELAQLIPDLLVKNLDVADSGELLKRVRKHMINQGIDEPTDDEVREFGIDQQEAIRQALIPQITAELQQEGNVRILHGQADELFARAQEAMTRADLNSAKLRDMLAGIQKKLAEINKTNMEANETAIDATAKHLTMLIDKIDNGLPLTAVDFQQRLDQNEMIDRTQAVANPEGVLLEER